MNDRKHPFFVPGPENIEEMYSFADWLAARSIPHTVHLMGPDGSMCIETETDMCQWERDWRKEFDVSQKGQAV